MADTPHTMTAAEERDLLARQRDWLLTQIAMNHRSARWMRDTIHQAFLHDPADNVDQWKPAPGHEVEVLADRVMEQAAALGLDSRMALLFDGTAEIVIGPKRVTTAAGDSAGEAGR